jgi:MscS family membrane protein
VPLLRKTLRVFVVIIAALFIAQNIFRWDIGALIAGLGIGGLAFALAAKDMLSNFFGSVTIFADRPFQMGDRIMIKGYDGFVEEVGFRSTRIRTFFGHLVTVPNAVIASEPVENAGVRPYIRRNFEITITYDTPPEKVRQAMDILYEMLAARKDQFPPDLPGWVHFMNYNAASLGIAVTYWFGSTDWKEYLDFTSEFNLELLGRYNEAGIEFAFPTQTIYVKKDQEDVGGQ